LEEQALVFISAVVGVITNNSKAGAADWLLLFCLLVITPTRAAKFVIQEETIWQAARQAPPENQSFTCHPEPGVGPPYRSKDLTQLLFRFIGFQHKGQDQHRYKSYFLFGHGGVVTFNYKSYPARR
jgi:hypothetical protein